MSVLSTRSPILNFVLCGPAEGGGGGELLKIDDRLTSLIVRSLLSLDGGGGGRLVFVDHSSQLSKKSWATPPLFLIQFTSSALDMYNFMGLYVNIELGGPRSGLYVQFVMSQIVCLDPPSF